jgi:hypothetical protein
MLGWKDNFEIDRDLILTTLEAFAESVDIAHQKRGPADPIVRISGTKLVTHPCLVAVPTRVGVSDFDLYRRRWVRPGKPGLLTEPAPKSDLSMSQAPALPALDSQPSGEDEPAAGESGGG